MFNIAFSRLRLAQGLVLGLLLAITAGCGGGGGSGHSAPAAPSALAYPSPQVYTVATAIAPLNPTVSGTVANYGVSPGLPAGLTLNASSGQITGTPTAATAAAAYTVTAQNSAGSTTFALSISILPAAPSALSYSSPQTYLIGTAIAPLNPLVTGVVTKYTISPALPPGLAISPVSGQISGTPTAITPMANYTITAQNDGGSASFLLGITVSAVPPSSLSYPSPQKLALGFAITPLNPSVVGTSPTYSVSPALPAGLAIAAGTGQLTGTPTAAQPAANYTVTAQNSAGSTTFSLSIAVVTVTPSPSKFSRMVVSGTSVTVALSIVPVDFSFFGTLSATAADAAGVFAPAVSVTGGGGTSTLALATSTRAPPGHYTGNVTIALCSDAACTIPQAVPSVTIPYDIYVLSPAGAWPGNNLSALAPWPGVPDWTMFQGNAAHTGYVPVDLDPNSFSTRWQTPAIDIPVSYATNLNTLTESNGQLFIGGGTTLYARKELDGSAVWQYDFAGLANPSVNPPSAANGIVYVAAGQQQSTYMFAFNAANGTLVFKSPMSSQWEHYLAPTIGPQGIYTNAGSYGGLYGFDTAGQQLFFANMAQTSQWTPAVDANAVYTYTGDALKVLDPVTGAVRSSIADPTYQNYIYEINGSPVLGAPGSVFAADYANSGINGGGIGNTLLDFNVTSGSIAWKNTGDYPSTPAYHAGVLYVANNNPVRLEARAEADGTLLWSWVPPQAGDTGFVSETLLTNTMIFVSTNLATYGIDTSTHQTVWSYPLVGKLALSRSGILYIEGQQTPTSPSTPGTLSAINVK
jgi:hypothetical protein